MTRVYLSYRRQDAGAFATRLHDSLTAFFGEAFVIIDTELREHAVRRGAVRSSAAVVVIIGPDWLSIDGPDDPVRMEIEAAFSAGIPVLPVLVEGASMPEADELPPTLRNLAYLSALRLEEGRWTDGIRLLAEVLTAVTISNVWDGDRDTPAAEAMPPLPSPSASLPPASAPPPFMKSPPAEVRTTGRRPSRSERPSAFERVRGWRVLQLRRRTEGPGGLHRQRTSAPAAVTFDPAPEQIGDVVDCSVFAPAEVRSGRQVVVQVYVHMLEQTVEVRSLAQEVDSDAGRRAVRTLADLIPRGTLLHFDLAIAPLRVEEPVDSLVWRGRPATVQFQVSIPDDAPAGPVIGRVGVTRGGVPIGHIRFRITVVDGRRPSAKVTPTGDRAVRYKSAFVSYASTDRVEVVKRLQMLPAVGISFFFDVDLEPGERWAQHLYKKIDDCDVFLLFWSSAARASEWVRREAGYALERSASTDDGSPDIRPVILEGPPFPLPWTELAHLHFADKLRYVLAATE